MFNTWLHLDNYPTCRATKIQQGLATKYWDVGTCGQPVEIPYNYTPFIVAPTEFANISTVLN